MRAAAIIVALVFVAACIHQLVALEPVRALVCAIIAGAIFGWLEAREQREFLDRHRLSSADWWRHL